MEAWKVGITIMCLIVLVWPNSLLAQSVEAVADVAGWEDRSDELPGLSSTEEILTGTLISVTGYLVATVVFPKPEPAFRITRSELIGEKQRVPPGRAAALSRLEAFSGPVAVRRRGLFGRTEIGIARSVGNPRFVVETRADSVAFAFDDVKEIIDLESAAKRAQVNRFRQGALYGGMALSYFYYAALSDNPLEGQERALDWVLFGLYGGISAYSFFLKSKVEKEYEIWSKEIDWEMTPTISFQGRSVGAGFRLQVTY